MTIFVSILINVNKIKNEKIKTNPPVIGTDSLDTKDLCGNVFISTMIFFFFRDII